LKACISQVCTWIICLFLFNALALGQTLSGTVQNGTTNQPAGGDDVILLKLAQGMEEAGRTKADAQGKFSFKIDDASSPHLVRVVHQGVTYHRMAPPGTDSVKVDIYDVAKKVDALSVQASVMRFQAQGNELQGILLLAVNNQSKPPRTQMNDQNFEFYLPDGATIEQGLAMTSGGQPINSAPVPQKEKNRYAFLFPLRPGLSQFQVVFRMNYSGSLNVDPKLLYPSEHFVVLIPKTMQFEAASADKYQSMPDPTQADAVVQVASKTTVGQNLSFKISGTGVLADSRDESASQGGQIGGPQVSGPPGTENRPGGGIGAPIEGSDPLEKYRWYILPVFGVALLAGAYFIVKRTKSAPVVDFEDSDIQLPPPPPAKKASPVPIHDAPASARSGLLLEALKEELFQLEVDRKQGAISQQEYEQAKAALDQTLERALKRETAKT
jgi:hypothetical protein